MTILVFMLREDDTDEWITDFHLRPPINPGMISNNHAKSTLC